MTQVAWADARASREGKDHRTRTELLRSAAEVFAANGYARTTTAAITEVANVSRASFYLYFTSKQDIFLSVAAQVRDDVLAVHEVPGIDEDDPVALGRASSAASLDVYSRDLDLMTVIEHQAISDPTIAVIWAEMQERPRRRMVRYVERLTAAGIAHPATDADAVADAVLAMFAQFARRRIVDKSVFDHTVDQLNSMYLRLLGIESGPPAEL